MPRNPVEPTHVYQPMAQHMPVEYYRPQQPVCQCGGHAQAQPQQPVQQIIVKQADPFARYLGLGFAAAAIGLMVMASLVITLVALGFCALCFAAVAWVVRPMIQRKKG